MPCLAVIFALAVPRLLILGLWFLTNWFRGMFHGILIPALGFLFLPTTFLWYSAVQHWFGGHWTFWPIVGCIVAVMIDLSPSRGRRTQRA